jgi:hypothetical protein
MRKFYPAAILALALVLVSPVHDVALALDHGGTPASHGLEPIVTVRNAVVGRAAVVTISNLPDNAGRVLLAAKAGYSGMDLSAYYGPGAMLVPNIEFDPYADPPFSPTKVRAGDSARRFVSKRIPDHFAGRTFYVQAFVEDPENTGGYALSDGILVTVESSYAVDPRLEAAGDLPSGRDLAAAAYDPESGVAYLFGGLDGQYLDQIVAFNPGHPFERQIEILEDRLPSPRSATAAVWDSSRGVAYVFGGLEIFYPTLDEIVVFDPSRPVGQQVTVLPDALPFYIASASAVWDEVREKAYLFGGNNSNGAVVEFDPWAPAGSRVHVLPDTLPDARLGSSAVWDPVRDVAYVFGGLGSSTVSQIVEFDPARPSGQRLTILPETLPSPRFRSTAVWDRDRGVALVFGGDTSNSWKQIVEFNPSKPAGYRLRVLPTQLPEPVTQASGVYDSKRDCAYILGGAEDGQIRSNEVWQVRAHVSEVRKTGRFPTPRAGVAVCQDPQTGATYSFGGDGDGGALAEIVAINARNDAFFQTEALEDTLPTARHHACAVWDPIRRRAYVFGGKNSSLLRQIVEFDPDRVPGDRVHVLSDTLPFGLWGGSAVWDDVRSVAYLIGGSSPSGEILEFDPAAAPGNKIRVLPESFSRSRFYSGVVWDDRDKVAYILGGYSLSRLDDIMIFDPSRPAGSRLTTAPETLPYATAQAGAVWNSAIGVADLVGGDSGATLGNLVRFDPSRPVGQRVALLSVAIENRSASIGFFDPVAALPVFVGGYDENFDYVDSFLIMSWK